MNATLLRLRRLLDNSIPEVVCSPRELLWAAATGLLVLTEIAIRVPSAWSTVWAEDGHIFLAQAVSHGAASFGTFYEGYLHTVPRVGALVASAFPISSAAFILTSYAVFVTVASAALTELACGAWIRSRWIRVGVASSFGLLPQAGVENLANMACLQFVMFPTAFWLMVVVVRSNKVQLTAAAYLVACAFTTLGSLFLLPLVIARLFVRRRMLAAVYLTAQLIYVGLIVAFHPHRAVPNPWRMSTVVAYFHFVVGPLLGGTPVGDSLDNWRFGAFAAGSVAILLVLLLGHVARRRIGTHVLFATGTVLLSFLIFALEMTQASEGVRYSVPSALLLVFALGVFADRALSLPRSRTVAFILAGLMAISWWSGFSPWAYRTAGPRWLPAVAAARRVCKTKAASDVRVPILPVGAHPPWSVLLPCRVLS